MARFRPRRCCLRWRRCCGWPACSKGSPVADREPFDHTKFAAARLRAAGLLPFLAMALYALSPVVDYSRDTFAVDDRWRLYINPGRLAQWSVLEVAGVLLHEVSHVVRDHAGRARSCIDASELAQLR